MRWANHEERVLISANVSAKEIKQIFARKGFENADLQRSQIKAPNARNMKVSQARSEASASALVKAPQIDEA
jgi:arsenate reductase-like glutaredoxin family protein